MEEDDERTHVWYVDTDTQWPYKFVFFNEWSLNLWNRVLGRVATEHEEAIENRRYMRKPYGKED